MDLIKGNNQFLLYGNVLTATQNAQLYNFSQENLSKYNNSRVVHFNDRKADWRKSKVIYRNNFREYYLSMQKIVLGKLSEIKTLLAIEDFELGTTQMQLTAHNHGDYYKWHKDNSHESTSNRIITFVYYFHSIPKVFSGGQLVLYPADGSKYAIVEPTNNTMVFFKSSLLHEVKPVINPDMLFKNARLTLNGWIVKSSKESI